MTICLGTCRRGSGEVNMCFVSSFLFGVFDNNNHMLRGIRSGDPPSHAWPKGRRPVQPAERPATGPGAKLEDPNSFNLFPLYGWPQ